MVDLNTVLVSAALAATSINTLITTFLLFHQFNEKTRVLKVIQKATTAMVIVAKKHPHLERPHLRGRRGNATASV
jgi:hypothetical protein